MTVLLTLLEITVYSAILFGAIWLFRVMLKKHLSPVMLYAAWFLLIARLLIPVTLSAGFSFIVVPAQEPAQLAQTAWTPESIGDADTFGAGYSELQKEQVGTEQHENASALDAQDITEQTPAAEASQRNITWDAAVIVLWLAGAAVMMTATVVSMLKLKRRLKAASPIPQRWNVIADGIKTDLGIKRDIRIVMLKGFPSPALTAGLRPTVVLPEELLLKSEENVHFALLHELTHIKRKDNAVSLLLLILRCVYWFNPVVWLSVRRIHLDMESACDSMLVRPMDARTKKRYAVTMLSMYADKQVRYVLGMAIGQTKRTAERRLRCMFMCTRSSSRGRWAAILMCCILLFTCFTTACQPTPAKPFVQSKTSDSVQQAIESNAPGSTAQIHRYSAPETWQSETHYDAKNIDINVKASVTVPDDTWGIYELIPKRADRDHLEKVLGTLIGDAQLYGEDTYMSKDELQTELVRLRGQLEKAKDIKAEPKKIDGDIDTGKGEGPTVTGGPDASGLVFVDLEAELEKQIAAIESILASAPDTETIKRVSIDLGILFEDDPDIPETNAGALKFGMSSVNVYDGGLVEIHALADTGKAEPASVNLYKSPDGGIDILICDAGAGNTGGFSMREPLGADVYKANISQDEAAKIARQAVSDMGFDYLDIAAVHKMSIYDKKRMEKDRMPECYAFTFTRSLDGIPATYAYWSGAMTDEEWEQYELEYAVNWDPAEVLIGVDERGVVYTEIKAPPSDVNVLAEGIELKSFDDIMEIFNQQAAIEGCFSPLGLAETVVGRSVNVDEIRLGYMPTIWKDHPNGIIFVPVWDFFGSETTTYDPNYEDKDRSDLYASLDENFQRTDDLREQAILTINALDGTIMRRREGPC